jgi:hypothetical protein
MSDIAIVGHVRAGTERGVSTTTGSGARVGGGVESAAWQPTAATTRHETKRELGTPDGRSRRPEVPWNVGRAVVSHRARPRLGYGQNDARANSTPTPNDSMSWS